MEKEVQNVKVAATDSLKAIVKVVADGLLLTSQLTGGISQDEIITLIQGAKDIQALLAVDPSTIIPQFVDMDAAAQADLVAFVNANISFPANVAVEAFVEKVLGVAISLSSALKLILG